MMLFSCLHIIDLPWEECAVGLFTGKDTVLDKSVDNWIIAMSVHFPTQVENN
jgi:hypothetical protein